MELFIKYSKNYYFDDKDRDIYVLGKVFYKKEFIVLGTLSLMTLFTKNLNSETASSLNFAKQKRTQSKKGIKTKHFVEYLSRLM